MQAIGLFTGLVSWFIQKGNCLSKNQIYMAPIVHIIKVAKILLISLNS